MKPEFIPGDRAVLIKGPGQRLRPELAHLEGREVLVIGELMERELFQDLDRTYAVPTWCYRVSAGSHRFCVQPQNLVRPNTVGDPQIVRQELGDWSLGPWRPPLRERR